MQTLSALIAGFVLYCEFLSAVASGGRRPTENMRCVETDARAQ